MKYIIMCGGNYKFWEQPKHLTPVCGEPIVARTIRLLRKAGVTDIAISSNDKRFEQFGVPVLKFDNDYVAVAMGKLEGSWYHGFYHTDEPVCYVFGDVVFSPEAIEKIVVTQTDDVEFFASAPPFSPVYSKSYGEPFGFKVVNQAHFHKALKDIEDYDKQGLFRRKPIAWELWQVIKGTELNKIDYTNYTVINDYTCDIDSPKDVEKIEPHVTDKITYVKNSEVKGPRYMIHAMPKRMWYVQSYLIPSMLEQGIKESQIHVYNDVSHKGNLKACMNAFSNCVGEGGTWHLQDDVIICRDFKERTEWYDSGLVCGFSSELYDGSAEYKKGEVKHNNMWFSFPCIRIPNEWARDCAVWVNQYIIGNPVYEKYWKNGVNDDWMFRTYVKEFHPDAVALNIMPNLVNHIDYLIGGGTGASKRKKPCVSQYWKDDDLVERLEVELNGRKK